MSYTTGPSSPQLQKISTKPSYYNEVINKRSCLIYCISLVRARFLSLLSSAEDNCLLVVIGTKCDLLSELNRGCSQEDAMVFAKEVNRRILDSVVYFETSSVTGQNANRVFEYIFTTLLPFDVLPDQLRKPCSGSTVDLEGTKEKVGQPKSGCC